MSRRNKRHENPLDGNKRMAILITMNKCNSVDFGH